MSDDDDVSETWEAMDLLVRYCNMSDNNGDKAAKV